MLIVCWKSSGYFLYCSIQLYGEDRKKRRRLAEMCYLLAYITMRDNDYRMPLGSFPVRFNWKSPNGVDTRTASSRRSSPIVSDAY